MAVLADDAPWDFISAAAPVDFVNEVCARIAIRLDKYHPIHKMKKIRCPVLLQTAEKDIGNPRKVVDKASRLLGERGEVIRYPIDHFDIYLGDDFERAVGDQVIFFKKHLL